MNSFIFDIDGTICPIKLPNEKYEDLIPYPEMVKKIRSLKKRNFKIVLFTARNMRTYDQDLEKILLYTKPKIEKWLEKWDIPYDELICGKPWPGKEGFYVDDRTIRPDELLNHSLKELKEITIKCRLDK